ncbi:putative zinc-finger-Ran binding domain-containing protein [Neospora caninum Liverpool]|uniref:Putative zinc-finger-Ran binding domain-containing protein n=1 Tax=Neospora caninum (strain Liverpool) TaxID=572307 RepID=F0VRK5_NEOCL|nr:putative zinc-finger-Ran binding domain-containing protein [Neospora caninum Liverpool]CBZ56353.1 putative zinc-finger-Ran binding domain-containing protein [Neospora caninum Liverpool]CEL71113.1 TPA: zinc-finger-Ran binding domain-containing protein, putative [Neospora caninum Liverpool]|eukprot:XP_003886378.1 putative zinc-finger-Ran binding domain-containing protein [Neospora caninum Liverpool]
MSAPVPYFSTDAAARQNLFLSAPPVPPVPPTTLCPSSSKAAASPGASVAALPGRTEDADAAAILQLHLQLSQQLQRSPVTEGDIFRALKKLARNSGGGPSGGNGNPSGTSGGSSPAFLEPVPQSGGSTEGDYPPPPPSQEMYTHMRSGSSHSVRGADGKRGASSASRGNGHLSQSGVFGGSGLAGLGSVAPASSHGLSSLSFQGPPEGTGTPRGAGGWRCRYCSTLNAGCLPGRCVCCGKMQSQKRGNAQKASASQVLGQGTHGTCSVQNLQIQQLRRDVLLAAVTAAAAAAEKRVEDKKEAKRAAAAVSAVATAMAESRQQLLLSENPPTSPYFSGGRVAGNSRAGLASDSGSTGNLYEDPAAAAVAAASLLPGLLGSLEASSGGNGGTPSGSVQSPSTSLTSIEDGVMGRAHPASPGVVGASLFPSLAASASFDGDGAPNACVGRSAGLIPDLGALGTGLGSLKGKRNLLSSFDDQSTPGQNFLGDSSSTGLRQSVGNLADGGSSTPGTYSLLQDPNAYGVDLTVFQELASAPQSTFFTDDVTPVDSLSLVSDCRSPSGATPSSIVSGRSSFCHSGIAGGVATPGSRGRDSNGNSSTNGGSPTTGTNGLSSRSNGGARLLATGPVGAGGGSPPNRESPPGMVDLTPGNGLTVAAADSKEGKNGGHRFPDGAGRARNSSVRCDPKRMDVSTFPGHAPLPVGNGPETSGGASTSSFNALTPSTQSSLPQHLQALQHPAGSSLLQMKGDTSTSSCASFLRAASSSPSVMVGEEESPVSALLEGLGLSSTANSAGIDALLPSVLSPIQVLLLKAKEVADRLVGDFTVLGYNDPTAKAAEALRTSLAILGFAPPPQGVGSPEDDLPGSAGLRGNSGPGGKGKQNDAGPGKDSDDDKKPKNANWTQGIGGPHFSAPTMLAHPDEFKNPSSFLKIYGDPMCAVVDASMPQAGRQTGPGGRALPGFSGRVDGASALAGGSTGNLPIRGHNGNWVCESCSNVNFPRRFRCNKCGAVRGPQGDAIVAEYAKLVYHQHVKTYRTLASRPGVDLPLKRLQNGSSNPGNAGTSPALQKGAGGGQGLNRLGGGTVSAFSAVPGSASNAQGHDGAFSLNRNVGGSGHGVSSATRGLASADTAGLNVSGVQGQVVGSQVTLPAVDPRRPAIPQPPSTTPSNVQTGGIHADALRPGVNFAASGPARCGPTGVPAPPPPTPQPPPVHPSVRAPAKQDVTGGKPLAGARGASGVLRSVNVDEKKGAKKLSISDRGVTQATCPETGTGKEEKLGNGDRKREVCDVDAAEGRTQAGNESAASAGGGNHVTVSGKPSVTSTTSGPLSSVSSPRADDVSSPVSSGDDSEATP